ncbi:SDR family NAD(P)-dependent oxidoreductase [Actimicrobium antarcticum]|uniref:Bifunctional NADP-dependent 3-hydroxy acid dehydrogenase/3-hydroxypropionate dehydrogenase YdfG n=1 Tax=Actimicrobium antarcticum TaxID=1051899 RepID=A0ABP7SSE4_9BURK
MIVLITGASAGFGEVIAQRLCADGHTVVATARRADKLRTLAARSGPGLVPMALDVCARQDVFALVEQVTREVGPIDVLINNAGLALGLGPAHEADLDEWETMVDTNIKGVLYCTRAALPGMVARNSGTIINMGSVAGTYPYPGANVYGSTKAFVHQFSLNLRADLVGKNIRVTSIEPGLCSGTEFSVTRLHGDVERAAGIYAGTQALTATDIADTVSWLVSRPAHVNINTIEMMPTCQASGNFAIVRHAT